eukprot:TRINITY_DN11419_c0_g1_i12.p1 TRINITY_DN11419_c0_g1~~TRINITY_DN11419_c0_g1_i12.p1  ORF type:complete len:183 (+),score=42.66 TRINITY_DN11419_c0_g1_i12:72-620(+)
MCIRDRDKDGFIVSRFDQLSFTERYTRFQNQSYIIKQLKRKLRTGAKVPADATRKVLAEADEIVRRSNVELDDQRELLSNLLTALNEHKLLAGSLQFDRISTIVRCSLEHLEDRQAFSSRELSEYENLLQFQGIGNILRGKPLEREVTQREVVEQYVMMQSEFLKRKTYQEFIGTLKKGENG